MLFFFFIACVRRRGEEYEDQSITHILYGIMYIVHRHIFKRLGSGANLVIAQTKQIKSLLLGEVDPTYKYLTHTSLFIPCRAGGI